MPGPRGGSCGLFTVLPAASFAQYPRGGRSKSARRQAFANDLTRPQLIAVTDNVNQAKGDPRPRRLAAVGRLVPLHLRQDVDHRQILLGTRPASLGEVGAADHA